MPDIFLSYSREDQATARRYAEAFQRAGLSVWWDQALNPGEAFDHVTEQALEEARAVVVLWSKASVGSRWVRAEATQANSSGKLVPVMIESCKRPIMFELSHTADLSAWKGDDGDPAWQSLVGGIARLAGREQPKGSPAEPVARDTQRTQRWPLVFSLLGAVLLLGLGGWLLSRGSKAPDAAPSAAIAPNSQVRRLLVLPFTNISEDKDQDYFASGLTEELLTQLQQIRALTVLGRETSFAFQGKATDPAELRLRLDVDYLLSGSVRKDGDRVKITPSLTDTATGRQLWNQSFEGQLKDVWTLQEQIAVEVARALSITLDVGDMPRAAGGTTNVEAYDKYLMASEQVRHGDIRIAVALLREAVRIDPDFVAAWATLSSLLAPASNNLGGAAAAAMARERMDIISRLDARKLPGAMGHGIHAFHSWWTHDWQEAVDAGAAAMAAAPEARLGAFFTLMAVGRLNEAIPIGQAMVLDNPLDIGTSQILIQAMAASGRVTEAQSEYERIAKQGLSIPAQSRTLGRLTMTGSATNPEDLRLLKELTAANPGGPGFIPSEILRAHPEVPMENLAAMRAMLAKALQDPANQSEGRIYAIADLATFYGDNELALRALRRNIVELQYPWPLGVWQFPKLRGEPGFRQLLKDMKLVDYWKSSGKWGDFCRPAGTDDFTCQ